MCKYYNYSFDINVGYEKRFKWYSHIVLSLYFEIIGWNDLIVIYFELFTKKRPTLSQIIVIILFVRRRVLKIGT